jgi:hypothetical protein
VGVSHHKVHDPVAAGRGVIEGQVGPRSRRLQVEEPCILEHRRDAPLLKDGPSLHLKSTVRAVGATACGATEDVGGAESVQGLVGGAVTVGEELKLREGEAKAVLQAENGVSRRKVEAVLARGRPRREPGARTCTLQSHQAAAGVVCVGWVGEGLGLVAHLLMERDV